MPDAYFAGGLIAQRFQRASLSPASSDRRACPRLQVIRPGGLPREAESAAVHPPQRLDFSPVELLTLERFAEAARAWGWRWRLVRQGPDQAKSAAVLTRAAAVLGAPLNGTELQAGSRALHRCLPALACCAPRGGDLQAWKGAAKHV